MNKMTLRNSAKALLKQASKISLSGIPVPLDYYRSKVRRDVVGFFFHIVSDVPVPHVSNIYKYKKQNRFERDLLELKKLFTFIDYDTLEKHRVAGAPIPDNAAIMTSDDGFRENYTVVAPILERLEIPCLFFVVRDFTDNRVLLFRNKVSLCIEKAGAISSSERMSKLKKSEEISGVKFRNHIDFSRWLFHLGQQNIPMVDAVCDIFQVDAEEYLKTHKPYLSTNEIREMSERGFYFGGHTTQHQNLQKANPVEIEEEVVASCEFVRGITCRDTVPFAFPYSGEKVNRNIIDDIRSKHDNIGLFFDTLLLREDSRHVVNRIGIDSPDIGIMQTIRKAYLGEIRHRD